MKEFGVSISLRINAHDEEHCRELVEEAIRVNPFLEEYGVEEFSIIDLFPFDD